MNVVLVTVDITVVEAGVSAITLVTCSMSAKSLKAGIGLDLTVLCDKVVVVKLTLVGVGMDKQEQADVSEGPCHCVKQVGVPIGTDVLAVHDVD